MAKYGRVETVDMLFSLRTLRHPGHHFRWAASSSGWCHGFLGAIPGVREAPGAQNGAPAAGGLRRARTSPQRAAASIRARLMLHNKESYKKCCKFVLGALAMAALIATALVLVLWKPGLGPAEAACAKDERVYYPLGRTWGRFSFMFCCPCCADPDEPLCYDEMLRWLGTWYQDTLTTKEQLSLSHHLYSMLVVRGQRLRQPAPLPPAETAAWLDNACELVSRTLPRRGGGTTTIATTNRTSVIPALNSTDTLGTPEAPNLYAPEEFSLLLVEMGYGQDLAMFKMAFSKPLRTPS
ncbi:protein ORF5 [Cyprinid herpesvirus 1]|uniref:Protein ORF5 n=1 Tax=Cyprinid herpesvirus 1 TaxID=317858 RepID=K7PC47_9VIRU|nr:protein ORF5 [Cyprinid herpesvirus 1]YP_007003819.1 protein ORF5 [Cyprinid herpesvirus 1]AFJ20317.1 protein ORF5 [Cyprinid herpesvirus 1]AFJ20450.1 protein ORF5 [Cyprinid herpesvirus 1]